MENNQKSIKFMSNQFNMTLKVMIATIFMTFLGVFNIMAEKTETAIVQQQGVAIFKGTVLDELGQPLIGASVYVDGTTIGVITDLDGRFSLTLPVNENIAVTISFLGLETQTYVFKGKNETVTIKLKLDDTMLSDVVVIGYGTKDKRSLTSSVSSIGEKQLENLTAASASFDNMLGGAIKGVRMNQTSGEPGATASINVRGVTSPFPNLTANQESNIPLYVIDGIPFFVEGRALNPLLSVAPNDIESIDVLKDASATAIYGSRGANGVIIVTTKGGRKNEKVSVNAGYTFSSSNPVKQYKPLNNTEFRSHQDLILRNTVGAMNNMVDYMPRSFADPYTLGILGDITEDYDPITWMPFYTYNGLLEEGFGNASTNWMDKITNSNAPMHQYNLAVRGGSEKADYSVSFNAMNQEGMLINDSFDHYGIRASLNADLSDRIKAGVTINYSNSVREGAGSWYSYSEPWLVRPDYEAYTEDGLFQRLDGRTLNYGLEYDMANPVARREKEITSKSNQFTGNAYIDIDLFKGLKFHSDINISNNIYKNNSFSPLVSQDVNTFFQPFVSTLTLSNSESLTTSVNFRFDYKLKKDEHDFTAMAGFGSDRSESESQSYDFEDFPNDDKLNNAGAAKHMVYYFDGNQKSGLNSVYSRLSYGYDNKYLSELSFRADESSKFGPGNRWGVFPALSLGWRMKNEDFLIDNYAVDDLKLRLSWGQTGSTNVPDFSYRQYFERTAGDIYGDEMAIMIRNLLPNRDVRWEMTTEWNAGLDFAFFNHRLQGNLDLYHRYTDGALAPSPHILESGMTYFYSNIIDMSNRGFEFELSGDIIRQTDFRWNLGFNISANRNKIEKLNSATILPGIQDSFIEGKPAGTRKGFKVINIIQSEEEIAAYNQAAQEKGHNYYQELFTTVGDYLIEDTNGDGRINIDDQVVIANPEPKFFGGITNSFNYKQFGLSFLMQFSKGAEAIWMPLLTDLSGIVGQSVNKETFGNTWTPENTDARYAQLIFEDQVSYNLQLNDRMIFDASYLRMKNITFTYELPQKFRSFLSLNQASVFASASNLFTITSWPGLDPELVGSGTTLMAMNTDPMPLSRSFSIGVKLNF